MECHFTGKACWAHFDWFCRHAGLARVFGEGQEFNIDPYCYRLPFVVRKRFWFPRLRAWWTKRPVQWGLVEFVGVVTPVMRPCQYRALRAMRAAGWGILSTRIKHGTKRTIQICNRDRKA